MSHRDYLASIEAGNTLFNEPKVAAALSAIRNAEGPISDARHQSLFHDVLVALMPEPAPVPVPAAAPHIQSDADRWEMLNRGLAAPGFHRFEI